MVFDYTSLLILLPALALAAYAQWKVQSTYSRYAAVDVARRTTAEEVARRILNAEYIQDVRRASTGDEIRVAFEGDGITTHLLVAGAPDTEVAVGTGPGGSILDRVPMGAVTRRGERQRFAAVIEPARAGAGATVTSIAIEDQEPAGGGATG